MGIPFPHLPLPQMVGTEIAGQTIGENFQNECQRSLLVPEDVVTAPKRPLNTELPFQVGGMAQIQAVDFAIEFRAEQAEVATDGLLGMAQVSLHHIRIPPGHPVHQPIAPNTLQHHLSPSGGAFQQGDRRRSIICFGNN